MLISNAYADDAAPAASTATTAGTHIAADNAAAVDYQSSPFSGIWVMALIAVIFYFMIIRPNQTKIKNYEEMVKALRRGDRIVTGGGVIGVISKIESDDVLVVEIAPDVKIRVMRETISHVINKTAVNDNKADAKTADEATN